MPWARYCLFCHPIDRPEGRSQRIENCHLLKDVAALIDFHAIVAVSWIGFMLSAVDSLGARAALFYTEFARMLPKKLRIFRGARK
jgi:hypothetical protein